ncbi:hypothetical protein [Cystobacter fuscus]|uniref:hypothetical protein n=1 Tax=Cystobacter fuscus TaxID=43 RepID=UPI002B293118|nr:hypothetical protein F0U63_12115 [Cystobacter fuscus]
MPYSNVQFIAHSIFTGPKEVTSTTETYLGLSTAAQDIQERVKLVGKAIDTARAHPKTVQANDTLILGLRRQRIQSADVSLLPVLWGVVLSMRSKGESTCTK